MVDLQLPLIHFFKIDEALTTVFFDEGIFDFL